MPGGGLDGDAARGDDDQAADGGFGGAQDAVYAVAQMARQGGDVLALRQPGHGEQHFHDAQQRVAGIRSAGKEFAQGLRALCDQYGAVLIADEVQTCFGRVADGPGTWFASQLFGITPDIMAIGKSFGGGYPVTAVVTTQEISSSMKGGYDGSTFGGKPIEVRGLVKVLMDFAAIEGHVAPAHVVRQDEHDVGEVALGVERLDERLGRRPGGGEVADRRLDHAGPDPGRGRCRAPCGGGRHAGR